MDKIEKLASITTSEFIKALVQVIEKEGFVDVNVDNNAIVATLKSMLSETPHCFIVLEQKLSGTTNTDDIVNDIVRTQNKYSANTTVISRSYISKGFKDRINDSIKNFKVNFIDRDALILLMDKNFPDFWKHDDIKLLQYEKDYKNEMSKDNELKQLNIPNEKIQKLVSIYIDPQLSTYTEDTKTHTPTKKRATLTDVIDDGKPLIISGLSGSGKSSLFKHAGDELILRNASDHAKKSIPVYITAMEIQNYNHEINELLKSKLAIRFGDGETKKVDLHNISQHYNIHLFVDSIDEFEEDKQAYIIKQLRNDFNDKGIKFYIGTRESGDRFLELMEIKNSQSYDINRFNSDQIRRFISTFFSGDEFKTDNLLNALRENKIIEKLPITPLTLSLISILYEETDFEIPATIADIYDNFNSLIIGKAVVSSKVEFIDIAFKERILSLYATLLMNRPGHMPLTKEEFIQHFVDYFHGKTLPIKDAQLEDVLEYLIRNTGILYLKEHKWVSFSHDSYMEYYTAVEYFKFKQKDEQDLIDNFTDLNWQNVAIFYAGKAKDMPHFTEEINKKLKTLKRWDEYISGIQGAGYLLQALYMTDNQIRKDVVLTALDLVLESNEIIKKMAFDEKKLFKHFRLPILHLLNFVHFFEMFNSITLKVPLQLSYAELMEQLKRMTDTNYSDKAKIPMLGYKLLEIAVTLQSDRIRDNQPFETLVWNTDILKDPSLYLIADFSLAMLGKEKYKQLRTELKKEYRKQSLGVALQKIIEDPLTKIRFSALDNIHADRKVKILVEGKTDVMLIEHAFLVLTDGQNPYWNIKMATEHGDTGSSQAISKALESSLSYADDYDAIIAIYDHDNAGISEYKRLERDYDEMIPNTLKKHKKANVYLICLPVPGEMDKYLRTKQEFNFFEIEHYFPEQYLKEKDMVKELDIPGLYEIRTKKKTEFAKEVCKSTDPNLFKYFKDLFDIIDKVTNTKVDYIV